MLKSRWKIYDENGQGLVEYAMIIMLIALVVFVALGSLGGMLNTMFTTIAGKF